MTTTLRIPPQTLAGLGLGKKATADQVVAAVGALKTRTTPSGASTSPNAQWAEDEAYYALFPEERPGAAAASTSTPTPPSSGVDDDDELYRQLFGE